MVMEISDGSTGHEGRPAKPYPVCGAKKRQGEGYCQNKAGTGTDHPGTGRCKFHGGSTPTQVKGARKDIARAELRSMGRPADVEDPHAELMAALREAKGNVLYLRERVEALGDDTYGKILFPNGKPSGRAESHILVVQYSEWWLKWVQASAACIKAGIDKRSVEIEEAKVELFAQVLIGMLGDVEWALTADQRQAGRRIAARHLRALPTGA
jgi:hypothetical protein